MRLLFAAALTVLPLLAQIRIGNYFVTSPYGPSIIVDDAAGFVIDPVWEGKPKDVAYLAPAVIAPDFSWLQAAIKVGDANVRWTWGRTSEGAVAGMIETDKPAALLVRLPQTWPHFHAYYNATADGVEGAGLKAVGGEVPFSLRFQPRPALVRANTTAEADIHLALDPARATVFVAGVRDLPRLDQVPALLNTAAERYNAGRIQASGDWGDFAGAIAAVMNNARLYANDNRSVVHSIGRGWWMGSNPDLHPYFVWDFCWHALAASLEDPESAKQTIRALLSYQREDGRVPSFSHWSGENGTYVTVHRSMPPVGAMTMWKMYERRGDKAFLAEVYPALVRWHDWWHKARDGNRNGLLEWGSEQYLWQGAQFETGWDDNVEFENTKMSGVNMNADAVDLNALWAMDAEYLQKIAAALGNDSAARRFAREHADMNRRINERLWNDELGIYCSRLWEVPQAESEALAPAVPFPAGLEGEYFPNNAWARKPLPRHDGAPDFQFDAKVPVDGLPATGWTARWTGNLTVNASGAYRLRLSNPNARVSLDGKPVEFSIYEPDESRIVDLPLTAGRPVKVILEFFKAAEKETLRLSVHRLTSGKPGSDWLTRITPMNFYPLISGAPDPARAKRVLDWAYRTDKFWLEWPMPTVAKDDPVWPQQGYWHGHIWPPANYLVWLGLERYADAAHRNEFVNRSVRLFMNNWDEKRVACENYRSTDGKCGNMPHYTWSVLLSLIGLEAMAKTAPDLRPVPAADFPGSIVARRVPFGGKLYRLTAQGGKVTAEPEP